jgi:hypothetical protein
MRNRQVDILRSDRSAVILDWFEPFAASVLSRLDEYDDSRPKMVKGGSVIDLESFRRLEGAKKLPNP